MLHFYKKVLRLNTAPAQIECALRNSMFRVLPLHHGASLLMIAADGIEPPGQGLFACLTKDHPELLALLSPYMKSPVATNNYRTHHLFMLDAKDGRFRPARMLNCLLSSLGFAPDVNV